jgi:hypothetical protein
VWSCVFPSFSSDSPPPRSGSSRKHPRPRLIRRLYRVRDAADALDAGSCTCRGRRTPAAVATHVLARGRVAGLGRAVDPFLCIHPRRCHDALPRVVAGLKLVREV